MDGFKFDFFPLTCRSTLLPTSNPSVSEKIPHCGAKHNFSRKNPIKRIDCCGLLLKCLKRDYLYRSILVGRHDRESFSILVWLVQCPHLPWNQSHNLLVRLPTDEIKVPPVCKGFQTSRVWKHNWYGFVANAFNVCCRESFVLPTWLHQNHVLARMQYWLVLP